MKYPNWGEYDNAKKALERAIKAEAKLDRLIEGCMRCAGEDDHERFQRLRAEVERLRKVYAITNESWKKQVEENALLRKVVEAAREFISSTGCNPKECGKCDPKYIGFCRWSGIGQALAELDKEGER